MSDQTPDTNFRLGDDAPEPAEVEQESGEPESVSSESGKEKTRVRPWVWMVVVAVVAVLIAGPGSVALYVMRQHHTEQQQVDLALWWAPVSAQLEQCSKSVDDIKTNIAERTGTDVVNAAHELEACIKKVPTTQAPNDTVGLALSGAMSALHDVAAQALRLGTIMGESPYAQGNPDQFAAYLALQKEFLVAQVTLVSLEDVVRQAAGQTTSPLPTGAP